MHASMRHHSSPVLLAAVGAVAAGCRGATRMCGVRDDLASLGMHQISCCIALPASRAYMHVKGCNKRLLPVGGAGLRRRAISSHASALRVALLEYLCQLPQHGASSSCCRPCQCQSTGTVSVYQLKIWQASSHHLIQSYSVCLARYATLDCSATTSAPSTTDGNQSKA